MIDFLNCQIIDGGRFIQLGLEENFYLYTKCEKISWIKMTKVIQ